MVRHLVSLLLSIKEPSAVQAVHVHCKYIDGTEYCGCLCYVSSTSGVVLTTANGSVLSMTVQNLKYSLKRQLAEFQLLLLTTFPHTSYYKWQ